MKRSPTLHLRPEDSRVKDLRRAFGHLDDRLARFKTFPEARRDADKPFVAHRRHFHHPAVRHHVRDRTDAAPGEIDPSHFFAATVQDLLERQRNGLKGTEVDSLTPESAPGAYWKKERRASRSRDVPSRVGDDT